MEMDEVEKNKQQWVNDCSYQLPTYRAEVYFLEQEISVNEKNIQFR